MKRQKHFMKRILTIAVVAAMSATMAVPAFAAETASGSLYTDTEDASQLSADQVYGTGIYNVDGQNVYYLNGARQYTTNVIKVGTTWYNLVNGVVTGNTVAKNSSGWWYIDANGKVDFTFTGIASNANGNWYCKGGKVQFVTDVVKTTYNGVTAWYNIKGGKLTAGPDVARNSAGWWYIDQNGKVDFTANTIAKNSSGWWVIQNGKVNFSYNGIASNSNGSYKITKGKVTFADNGVIKVGNAWYYLVKSKVTNGPTVQNNSSGWWYINANGKVDFTFTGIAANNNGSWYCVNGKVQFGYSGTYTIGDIQYTIKNGKVVSQNSSNNGGIIDEGGDLDDSITNNGCTHLTQYVNTGKSYSEYSPMDQTFHTYQVWQCSVCGEYDYREVDSSGNYTTACSEQGHAHTWTEWIKKSNSGGEYYKCIICRGCHEKFYTQADYDAHRLEYGQGHLGSYTFTGALLYYKYCDTCGAKVWTDKEYDYPFEVD